MASKRIAEIYALSDNADNWNHEFAASIESEIRCLSSCAVDEKAYDDLYLAGLAMGRLKVLTKAAVNYYLTYLDVECKSTEMIVLYLAAIHTWIKYWESEWHPDGAELKGDICDLNMKNILQSLIDLCVRGNGPVPMLSCQVISFLLTTRPHQVSTVTLLDSGVNDGMSAKVQKTIANSLFATISLEEVIHMLEKLLQFVPCRGQLIFLRSISSKFSHSKEIVGSLTIHFQREFHTILDPGLGGYFREFMINLLHAHRELFRKTKKEWVHDWVSLFWKPLSSATTTVIDTDLVVIRDNFFKFVPRMVPKCIGCMLNLAQENPSQANVLICILAMSSMESLKLAPETHKFVDLIVNQHMRSFRKALSMASLRILLISDMFEPQRLTLLVKYFRELPWNMDEHSSRLLAEMISCSKKFIRAQANELINFTLGRLKELEIEKRYFYLLLLKTILNVAPTDQISSVVTQCSNSALSENFLERKLAAEILSAIQRNSSSYRNDDDTYNTRKLIAQVESANTIQKVDINANLLLLHANDAAKQEITTHCVSALRDVIDHSDNLLLSEIISVKCYLLKKIGGEFLTDHVQTLNKVFETAVKVLLPCLGQDDEGSDEESFSEDIVIVQSNNHKHSWLAIKYSCSIINDVFALTKDLDGANSLIQSIERKLTELKHWGAVKALSCIHFKLLQLVDEKRSFVIKEMLFKYIDNTLALPAIFSRVDGKHAGPANVVKDYILLIYNQKSTKYGHYHFNEILHMLIKKLRDSESSPTVVSNLYGLLALLASSREFRKSVDHRNVIKCLKLSFLGMEQENASIRSNSINLYNSVTRSVLHLESDVGSSERTIQDLSYVYTDILDVLYESICLEGTNTTGTYAAILFVSLLKPVDEECETKLLSLVLKCVGHRVWKIRELAVKASLKLMSMHQQRVMCKKLITQQAISKGSNNGNHGTEMLLRQLQENMSKKQIQ